MAAAIQVAGPIRLAEWGHWGITFYTRHNVTDYAPASVEGVVYFPVGTCGPCDVDRRADYIAAIRAWQHNGVLPAGLSKVGL